MGRASRVVLAYYFHLSCPSTLVLGVRVFQLQGIQLPADGDDRRIPKGGSDDEHTFVSDLFAKEPGHGWRRGSPSDAIGIGDRLKQFVGKNVVRGVRQLSIGSSGPRKK
jgi:hypothetical protein